jgi:hypothetical protein
MDQGAAAKTRSQLYRAITRAQMMVVVVNEVLHGGWLEFLTRVKYDKEKQFDIYGRGEEEECERKREQDGRGGEKT